MNNSEKPHIIIETPKLASARRIATLVYALQGASIICGLTFLIAAIINYVKLDDARGTWLESHFRWQIRTFWFTILWGVLGTLTVGMGLGLVILLACSVWFIYRIVKGWLNLNDGKAMYL